MLRGGLRARGSCSPAAGRKSLCTHLDSVTYVNNANRSIAGVPYTPGPVPRAQGTPTLLHGTPGKGITRPGAWGGGIPKLGFGHVLLFPLRFSIYIYLYVVSSPRKYIKNITEKVSPPNHRQQVLETGNEGLWPQERRGAGVAVGEGHI